LTGSRDTSREAFKRQLISDGEGWMMMLADRNRSPHMYDQAMADEIAEHIHRRYVGLFRQLAATLEGRLAED
jgi:nucleotidyltransferase substrate binding protein (TIGR01987 family)